MALLAFQSGVLADERELGPAVIEMAADGGKDQLESAGVMARCTTLIAECRPVGAFVAIHAVVVFQFDETRLAIIARRVTFNAIDLAVQAGEGISGLGVIESRAVLGVFPVHGRVALGAIRSKLALVVILVAIHAIAIEPEERLADVLQLDGAALLGDHFFWGVTLVAGLLRVVTHERPSRTRMIELLL